MGASFDMFTSQTRRALSLNAHERLAISTIWARGPQTMSDLGRWIPLSRAAVTTLVDRLEDAGLVCRVHDERDRRRVLVRLEQATLERMAPVFAPWGVGLHELLEQRTDAQWQVIASFIADLSALSGEHALELAQRSDEDLQSVAAAAGAHHA
jgi:DNA-binding MarR family transcriptional regulator